MRRRTYRMWLAVLLAVLAGSGQGVAQTQLARLCFLAFDPGSPEAPSARFAPFFKALSELGHVHGRTIAIDYLFPEGGSEPFSVLVEKCLRRRPDAIAVTSTPAALAAKAATRNVPIVMVSLADPVRTGLVASLAAPGGNVTGMSNMATELAAKRLSLLKEAVPRLTKVLVLTYLADPIARLQVEALKEAATSLGLSLVLQDVRSATDLPQAFDTGVSERANGLMTISASIFVVERASIAALAARHRLPAIYSHRLNVADAGGLLAYHIDETDVLKRAAGYVDRVLKGTKPADLAVQQPTKFEMVLNLKTAKALGLTIPPLVLAQADEVIE